MEISESGPTPEQSGKYLENLGLTRPLFICGKPVGPNMTQEEVNSLALQGIEEMGRHNIIGKRLNRKEIMEYAIITLKGLERYWKSVSGDRDPSVTKVTGIDGIYRVKSGRVRVIIYDNGNHLHAAPLYKKESGAKDSYQKPLDRLLNFMEKGEKISH